MCYGARCGDGSDAQRQVAGPLLLQELQLPHLQEKAPGTKVFQILQKSRVR